jgi:hypothetical protein
MARKSKAAIMREYDEAYAIAVSQISDKMDWVASDAARTIETGFGSATLIAMRWQPASIGGTWGTYRMTTGDTRGFCVSARELDAMARLTGIALPKYPR